MVQAKNNTLGVLLVNLGSPAAPTAAAVKPYLREFLSDRRVVDLPAWLWQPILRGIILRKRPPRSAALYAKIWRPDGSPLQVYSRAIETNLQTWAESQNLNWQVELAMTYGQPSMANTLASMQQQGIKRIVLVPLFPQYSTTTTAAVYDAYQRAVTALNYAPELIAIDDYHQQHEHIAALAASVTKHWHSHGRAEHLMMSFHGTPEATRRKGDPYFDQCQTTAKHLATKLGLQADEYSIAFQSRFGWQTWLQPYAEPLLEQMAKDSLGTVQVMCPGFAVDCLETLEEVALGFAETFAQAGGKSFGYIPCLNDSAAQVEAIAALVKSKLEFH
ncbi:MAG: ferrochelatase [Gammaproteobacteria bacterium]|nr:ferrochelatase [Gammaproteobacteria bacterium]